MDSVDGTHDRVSRIGLGLSGPSFRSPYGNGPVWRNDRDDGFASARIGDEGQLDHGCRAAIEMVEANRIRAGGRMRRAAPGFKSRAVLLQSVLLDEDGVAGSGRRACADVS